MFLLNVGKYTIHGCYGYWFHPNIWKNETRDPNICLRIGPETGGIEYMERNIEYMERTWASFTHQQTWKMKLSLEVLAYHTCWKFGGKREPVPSGFSICTCWISNLFFLHRHLPNCVRISNQSGRLQIQPHLLTGSTKNNTSLKQPPPPRFFTWT